MKDEHFVVHRHLSKLDNSIDAKDSLEEVLAMAEVDNMILQSSFVFIDAAGSQHLYLIFINK